MFFDLLKKRRSIRRFTDQPIEKEKIDQLVKAALLSPSSRGIRPWEFVVVDDRETLTDLSRCKPHGASFLKSAALGIAVVADPSQSDVWVEDASIASVYLLLAAEAVGLGACWSQIRNRNYTEKTPAADRVAELLGLPTGYAVEAIIAVGYPAEEKRAYADEDLKWEKVHYNRYGQKEPS